MPARPLVAATAVLALTLSGCVSPVAGPKGLYAPAMGSAPVTPNPTPYSKALVCLGDYARAHNLPSPRIAVGRIADYTGKDDTDGGRKITQGASLMAISALAKAGARMVERYDTSVSEFELKYANNKLITDAPNPTPGAPESWRHITAGQVPGSDFYLVGGITEFNYNIRSSGLDVSGKTFDPNRARGSLTGQLYVMNVGMDLRLVETRTMEVVDVISFQKQIIARQVGAGFFQLVGNAGITADVGESGLEPIQLAVRSVIERSVLEMMANLYGAPGPKVCLDIRHDPLASNSVTGGFQPGPYARPSPANDAATRQDPSRWDASRDSDVQRGRW